MKDINLLPDDMKKELGGGIIDLRDKLDPKKVLVGIIVVFVLAIIFCMPIFYNLILTQNLNSIETQIKNPNFEKVKKVNEDIINEDAKVSMKKNIITSIDMENVNSSEIFSSINSLLPQGSTLNKLSYNSGKISIAGTAKDSLQIGEIISRIKRSTLFNYDDKTLINFDNSGNFSTDLELKGNKK